MFGNMLFKILLAVMGANSQWITPSPVLPTPSASQIMGVWNDEIFLFSGFSSSIIARRLIKFNVSGESFLDYGTSALNISKQSWLGEVHGQIQNLLYLPNRESEITKIYVFDLSSYTVNTIISSISRPPIYTMGYGCLAAISNNKMHYLFMVGGFSGSALSNVQRYHIQNSSWDSISSMNIGRRGHSCIIDQDYYLWVIGGRFGNGEDDTYLSSIERALITSDGAKWQYNHQSLIQGTIVSRSVLYDCRIYVIGGANASKIHATFNYVTMIDTRTGNVSILSDRLNYPIAAVGAIITDYTIYIFGGNKGNMTIQDTWSKYALSSMNPTVCPHDENRSSLKGWVIAVIACGIILFLLVGFIVCYRQFIYNRRNNNHLRDSRFVELGSSEGPGRVM